MTACSSAASATARRWSTSATPIPSARGRGADHPAGRRRGARPPQRARQRDIDAIFCSSDTLAIGAVQECHRRGWKVPERLAIAGYGDIDLAAQLFRRLTTVRVKRYEMGRRAVEQLLRRLAGEQDLPTRQGIGFEIIDRESA